MNTRFSILMMTCVALACQTGYAERAAANDHRDQNAGHAPRKPQRSSRRGPAESKPPNQLGNRERHSAPAGALTPRRGLERSSPRAKTGLIENAIAGRPRPVRRPLNPVRAGAAPLSNERHHSPNPAVIAGSADLGRRNTGAIDGRQVPRRP